MKKILIIGLLLLGISLPTFALTSDELIKCVNSMSSYDRSRLLDAILNSGYSSDNFADQIYRLRDSYKFKDAVEYAIKDSYSIQNIIKNINK